MKKLLPILFILLSLLQAKASDTLTVRQVFNFNVGDTFNYRVVTELGPGQPSVFNFYTLLILNKWYSITQDTLYYTRASTLGADTIILTNLDSALSLKDTLCQQCTLQFVIDSSCNAIENKIIWSTGLYYSHISYIEGLGEVEAGNGSDSGFGIDTTLNYYVVDGVYHQTPFFTTGISAISNNPYVNIGPSPTARTLHVSLSSSNSYYHFILTDLLGKELLSQPITQTETTLDISNLANGLYTWRLMSGNEIIKTGKVVKQ